MWWNRASAPYTASSATDGSNRLQFESALNGWFERHKSFLNERSLHVKTGKSHYTHKRLRSAYNSLKRNLNYLFAFERFAELNIPKTTVAGRPLWGYEAETALSSGYEKRE